MKLVFTIDYYTHWGEELRLVLDGQAPVHVPMTCVADGRRWQATLELNSPTDYHYELTDSRGDLLRRESRGHRADDVTPNGVPRLMSDLWQDPYRDKPFHSSAFTKAIFRRQAPAAAAAPVSPGMVQFRVEFPAIRPGQTLALCGSPAVLGGWDPARAVPLSDAHYPLWEVTVPIDPAIERQFEYKYLIIDRSGGIVWEQGSNRRFNAPEGVAQAVVSDIEIAQPGEPWRGAGTAIPVFSLRSEDDYGIGDFVDLELMADWAAATHQQVVQLLPVNDTTMTHTWTDSYPYNSNSVFALHPIYLRPEAIGRLADPERREHYERIRQGLQALPYVDYERVENVKTAYVRELFRELGPETVITPEFAAFVEHNARWLVPYAAFCVLRDRFGTPDIRQWGEYAVYNPQRVAALVDANIIEIQFVYFQQYHLDKQLRHARAHALSKGVILKGDIPIGVSRDSADAWVEPQLYNMDASAGAPPDDFSVLGQNWGFPTYNWELMARDGYAWWKARFRKMADYFDAYRIDHVLGFFRIWQIPLDAVHGLLGFFNSALPYSSAELADLYGFELQEWMTKPYVTDWVLDEVFGSDAGFIRDCFLEPEGEGRWHLKHEFATQRAIADWFGRNGASLPANGEALCNGLLQLVEQVLFIQDPYKPDHWHPRITGDKTSAFKAMDQGSRDRYRHLYHDFYYRRNDDWWRDKAMQKLPPLIDSTGMLVCAEDLGMIPACVPDVMKRLQVLSLEIQRMPKDPATRFGQPSTYPYLSVCTVSTHDMPGIRQWWETDRETTQAFYNSQLGHDGITPLVAEPGICREILEQNLAAPSMLCILPLQDWLATDGILRRDDPYAEQINDPSNPRHYWRYRMHLTLEQLNAATEFNDSVREMIRLSGRD